ncbi:MAG: D-aminoacyl-tRNA deacylase [Turicibacter sp.]|nr:D-aminoacyl-tRNA deacylase [Turicibacter sp.]
MKIVVQRAKKAKVIVDEKTVGEIEHGLMILVGVTHDDTIEDAKFCANKVAKLRIFEDEAGKMNLSVKDVGGGILSISQFTLYGNSEKGNRPSFIEAARPEQAEPMYEQFNELLRSEHGLQVETGVFGAMMDIDFINDGPVTLILESKK